MTETQSICREMAPILDEKTKPMKHVKISDTMEGSISPKNIQPTSNQDAPLDIRKQRIKEFLEKEKQSEEERKKFMEESLKKKLAEREEIIKHAKRLILYRKPTCREINRALLSSECFRELDAQIEFQKYLETIDKNAELNYANLLKADVAKYEKEKKETMENRISKMKRYAFDLKNQIEENEKQTKEKEMKEFEDDKKYQKETEKYLENLKKHEEQELINMKRKMKKTFEDAIKERKEFDLKIKKEENFEDRAIDVYQNAKSRIRMIHKQVAENRKEEFEKKAKWTMENCQASVSSSDIWEKNFIKAVEEKKANLREKDKERSEYETRLRKETQDFHKKAMLEKLGQLEKEKDLKAWEIMRRFKKDECDKNLDAEEQKREWNKKIEYANSLKKDIIEKETEQNREKLLEETAAKTDHFIEKDNRRVLNYSEEVISESKGVRPLYPILKAVENWKREVGLVPLTKKKEVKIEGEPTKRRRRPRVCTKFVPEDKICYLK